VLAGFHVLLYVWLRVLFIVYVNMYVIAGLVDDVVGCVRVHVRLRVVVRLVACSSM